jgi:DNA (cytosine-5)-methyltransferase 1
MRHGSLFSGIGGFDLAAQWMGWENVFHCEWNEFGQKVLKYHFPQSESFSDITKTDFTKYEGTIDIISGGFPCQPFSQAGKREGVDDERYLWGEMLRAIQEIKPQFVVAENVFGITNIDGGMVFQQVCLDLETEGYEIQPFIIPACAKNAPHRRDRCWFIAYAKNGRCGRRLCERCTNGERELLPDEQRGHQMGCKIKGCSGIGNVTNCDSIGLERGLYEDRGERKISTLNASTFNPSSLRSQWQNFPTQPPICSGDDGLSDKLDGITFSNWRKESVKAYGNAIVPQVAYEIFSAIEKSLYL